MTSISAQSVLGLTQWEPATMPREWVRWLASAVQPDPLAWWMTLTPKPPPDGLTDAGFCDVNGQLTGLGRQMGEACATWRALAGPPFDFAEFGNLRVQAKRIPFQFEHARLAFQQLRDFTTGRNDDQHEQHRIKF